MKHKILGLLTVGLLAGPMAAQAVPMRLDATTTLPTSVSSWFVDFNDNGDGLFSLNELTFFSGVIHVFPFPHTYSTITLVPTLAGFTSGFTGNTWFFGGSSAPVFSSLSAASSLWSYQISATSVPEPGTLALLGLGLLGLGLTRRRAN